MKMKFGLFVLASILIASCGMYESKIPMGGVETVTLSAEEIGYNDIKSAVLDPSCVRCHNSSQADGGIALDSYTAVKANLGLVKNEAIDNKSMPPQSPLQPSQVQLLSDWITQGAPQYGTVKPSPTPAPTATPTRTGTPAPTATPTASPSVRVVYQTVKDQVFTAYCTRCHSGSYPSAGVGLDTYVKVKANLGQVQSTVLNRKTMPPSKPLPTPQQQLLKQWIDGGAPETSLDKKPQPLAWLGRLIENVLPSASAAPAPTYRDASGTVEFFDIGKPSMLKVHGVSSELKGELSRGPKGLGGKFTLPMESLKTGGLALRDRHLHEKVFEVSKFPMSELTLEPVAEGENKFKGKLKFHGIEKAIEGTGKTHIDGKQVAYEAEFKIHMSDFGIAPPEYLGMSMQDEVIMNVKGIASE